MPVGLNQIAGIRAGQRGELKVRSSRVGPAQVRAGEVGVMTGSIVVTSEIRIREVGLVRFAPVRKFAFVRLACRSVGVVKVRTRIGAVSCTGEARIAP